MKVVSREETMVYSSHSIKQTSPDDESTANTSVKGKLLYTSHSAKPNVGKGPKQDKVYELVTTAPYKQ